VSPSAREAWSQEAWAQELIGAIVRWGIEGAPIPNPLSGEPLLRLRSAAELAGEYRDKADRIGLASAIEELIEDQARWNAGSGFLTGIGGFAFLPVQLPAALTTSWVIQTRLVGAIAHLHGFDLEEEAVRTQILLTLIGEEAAEVLKLLGVKASQRFAQAQLGRLPASLLAGINRAVGFRLVSRAGRQGVVHLPQAIPLLGGLVGGGIDYWVTRQLGNHAAAELGRRQPRRPPAGTGRHASSGGGFWSEEVVIDVEILD
ncbi:MAG: EcsC family protein, partial [Cyanobium sp.]